MGSRDSRRILGPEKSIPYSLLQTQKRKYFLGQDSLRWDGRSAVDPRKLFMSVGVISQAKGSSYLEVGNTKVCCGVYGPMDVQRGSDFNMSCKVLCEIKMAPFSCSVRRSPQPDKQQREMSRQLKDALETVIVLDKFPKSQIDVYLTVIEDDGGLLAACITAAGLAICHANIDVYDLVIGASLLWHDGILYADPTHHEEEYEGHEIRNEGSEGGQLTVGVMPKYANGQVSLLVQGGQISADNLCEGLEVALEICQRIYTLSRKTLVEYVEQSLEVNQEEPLSATPEK